MSRYVVFALVVFVAVAVGCRKKSRNTDPASGDPIGGVKLDDAKPDANAAVAAETLRTRGARVMDAYGKKEGPVTTAFLTGAKFGDSDVALLKSIPTLRTVTLTESKVTDAGLAALADLSELQTLELQDTAITDTGLAHLRKLGKLNYLYLTGTSVTDAGMDSLKSLTALSHLDVKRTKVTDAGVARLKAAVPRVGVAQDTKYFTVAVAGQFSVEFPWKNPGTPQQRAQKTPFGMLTEYLYEVTDNASSAALRVADFSAPPLNQVNLEDVVKAGRDAVAQSVNGTVSTDKRTTSGDLVIRDIVIDIRGRNGQGPAYFRYVIHGRRLYTLAIMSDGLAVPPDIKDRFFGSFKVLR